ncbi:hypothetical protein TKK_0011563 [Trichogramma kaykai]
MGGRFCREHRCTNPGGECVIKNFGDPYEISLQEIDQKLAICEVRNEQTTKKLREIILKNRDVFYKKPGRLRNFEYELKLKDDKPFFVKPYPVPLNYKEKKIELAYDRIKIKRSRRADKANINRKKCDEFATGDKVLIKCKNISDQENKVMAKFMQIYEGPYFVNEKRSKNTYILTDTQERVKGQFHVNDLIRYRERAQTNENPI